MKSVVGPILSCVVLALASVPSGGVAVAAPASPVMDKGAPALARTPHGFVQMIGEALGEVTLRPDQETKVEQLGNEIEPLQTKVDQAESGLLLALAAQVDVGKIDKGALEPQVAGYVMARLAVSPEIRKVVEDLHGILDTAQREDFADALECRVHDVRLAIIAGEQVNSLVKDLDLDADQAAHLQNELQSLAPELETQRNLLHRIIEAFRGEEFSVESIFPAGDVSQRARDRAERIVDLTASLFDVLDLAQRAKLAEHIREAALARTDDEIGTAPAAGERVGASEDHIWVGGGRGRWGRWGGFRRGGPWVGSPGFAWRRVRPFPVAAGWGMGW